MKADINKNKQILILPENGVEAMGKTNAPF